MRTTCGKRYEYVCTDPDGAVKQLGWGDGGEGTEEFAAVVRANPCCRLHRAIDRMANNGAGREGTDTVQAS